MPWLERLDVGQQTFPRTEPALAALPLLPSEYIRSQVRFTPFPTEPVGWLIAQAGPELFLFSSDYRHPEGGRDPIASFEAGLEGVAEDARERFYWRNFPDMMGFPRRIPRSAAAASGPRSGAPTTTPDWARDAA